MKITSALSGVRRLDLECQASCLPGLLDEVLKARLEERARSLPESVDLLFVAVDANHIVSHGGERCGREQANVSGTKDDDFHPISYAGTCPQSG
jgi:hypothetical protein